MPLVEVAFVHCSRAGCLFVEAVHLEFGRVEACEGAYCVFERAVGVALEDLWVREVVGKFILFRYGR